MTASGEAGPALGHLWKGFGVIPAGEGRGSRWERQIPEDLGAPVPEARGPGALQA